MPYFQFKGGSTYTISYEGERDTRDKLADDGGTAQIFQFDRGCKFAFKFVEAPMIVAGKNQEFAEGAEQECIIKGDRYFSQITGVLCDGKELKQGTNYTVDNRNLSVVLSADFIKSLSLGEHTVRVCCDAGKSEPAIIKIGSKDNQEVLPDTGNDSKTEANTNNTVSPKSGDYSHTIAWCVLAVGMLLIISSVFVKYNRRK